MANVIPPPGQRKIALCKVKLPIAPQISTGGWTHAYVQDDLIWLRRGPELDQFVSDKVVVIVDEVALGVDYPWTF